MRKLLFGLCTVGLLASSLAQAEEHEWTNKQGKTIKAGFVSAGEEAVTISMKGKTYVVKLADLSPQSRALAAKLRVQKSKVREPQNDKTPPVKSPEVPKIDLDDNGQIKGLAQIKDGKPDGLTTMWHKNGQKQWESTYKDGKVMTIVSWKPNGEKCPDTNVVNGNGVWVIYNDDGREVGRGTYKDGKVVEDDED